MSREEPLNPLEKLSEEVDEKNEDKTSPNEEENVYQEDGCSPHHQTTVSSGISDRQASGSPANSGKSVWV